MKQNKNKENEKQKLVKIKLAAAIVETVMAIPVIGWFLYIITYGALGATSVTLGITSLIV